MANSYLQTEQWILFTFLNNILTFHAKVDPSNVFNKIIQVNSLNPELSFNRIFSCNPEIADFYNNLTQIQKAFLVPKLKIYRIDKTTGEDKEISFQTYFNAQEFKNISFGNIDVNTEDKLDGSAIKKITISDRPESLTDVNITCKIDLFFDNILSLNNSSVLELVRTPQRRIDFDSRDYRIKLVVGWHVPTDASGLHFSKQELKYISDTNIAYLLELTQHSLNFRENGSIDLSIEYQGALESILKTNKTFDILALTDDDKMSLKNYASVPLGNTTSGILISPDGTITPTKDPNIYTEIPTSEYSVAIQRRDQIDKYLKHLDTQRQKSLVSNDFQKQTADEIKELGEEYKKIQAKIADLELQLTRQKYVKILKNLSESDRIFFLDIPPELFMFEKDGIVNLGNIGGQESTLKDRISNSLEKRAETLAKNISNVRDGNRPGRSVAVEELKNIINSNAIGVPRKKQRTFIEGDDVIEPTGEFLTKEKTSSALTELLSELDSKTKLTEEQISGAKNFLGLSEEDLKQSNDNIDYEQYEIRRNNVVQTMIAKNRAILLKMVGGKKENRELLSLRVPYILFGDLLNIIMPDYDVDVIIGSIRLNDTVFNLSQLPISVHYFNSFFINNVIKTKRTSWFLWDFVAEVVKELIVPQMIGNNLGSDELPDLNVTKTTVLSKQQLRKGGIYTDTQLSHQLSKGIFENQKVYPYVIIYCYSYDLPYRIGNEDEDKKDGIYHFGIGQQKGIVKGIQFRKVEQPKVRDIRLTGDTLNRAGQILRENYDVTLNIVGSPLFVNGGHFYFDGSFLGAAGKKATDTLGLGGYYLVHGIETTFSPGKFDQQINGFWQSLASSGEQLNNKPQSTESIINSTELKRPNDIEED